MRKTKNKQSLLRLNLEHQTETFFKDTAGQPWSHPADCSSFLTLASFQMLISKTCPLRLVACAGSTATLRRAREWTWSARAQACVSSSSRYLISGFLTQFDISKMEIVTISTATIVVVVTWICVFRTTGGGSILTCGVNLHSNRLLSDHRNDNRRNQF